MKKILLSTLMMLLCSFVYAQDIIVTTESERIDAKITEVSDTEVKYKSATNPDGPVFVLSTNKIASIVFKNGEVKTFANANNTKVTHQNTTVSVREAKDIVFVPGQKIEKSERNDYFAGNSRTKYFYGNIEMDESLYRDFLKINCQKAYKKYMTGYGLMYGSLVFGGLSLGAGVGCMIGGRNDETLLIAGACVLGTGVAASLSCALAGAAIGLTAVDIFNEQCAGKKEVAQVRLSLTSSCNGVGLTLNF